MHLWHKLFVCSLFLSSILHGQWVSMDSIKIDLKATWELDALGNIYVADGDLITKIDTSGAVRYQQSVKRIGEVEKIMSVNSMRTLIFSENQQLFMLLDNTLTPVNEVYDLSELGYGYISMLAPSAQPKKVWLYDQLNSTLTLFDWARTGQQQRIENVQGILGAQDFIYMKESENNLHLVDKQGGYFILDRYGALIRESQLGLIESVYIEEGMVFLKINGSWVTTQTSGESPVMDEIFQKAAKISIHRNQAVVQQNEMLIKYSKKN